MTEKVATENPERTDGRTDGFDGWMDGQSDGRTDGRSDGQTTNGRKIFGRAENFRTVGRTLLYDWATQTQKQQQQQQNKKTKAFDQGATVP